MIAIVGGGITGLALGRELALRNREFVVLEAADEPGGVIRSERKDGLLLDWGPQRARLSDLFAGLTHDLDLGDQLLLAPLDLDFFICRDARLRRVPLSLGGFLASDAVSWRGRLRTLLEPFTAGPRDDESVAGFFTRKLGREVYEHVVGPLYGGLYGSDPKDMVVGLSLGRLLRAMGTRRSLLRPFLSRGGRLRPPPACSFADGMQTLPFTLAGTLGDRIRLSTPVRAIEPRRGGWNVVLDSESLAAEHVVLTVPARAAAALLGQVAPEAASRIASLRYNPLAVVCLRSETSLRGLGFQMSLAESRPLRGVTFNHSLFGAGGTTPRGRGRADRTGLYTAYLGGSTHGRAVGSDDHSLGELAAAEFHRCTGFEAQPVAVARQSMPAWDRSWSALEGLRLPTGIHVAANWESRPGLAGRLAQTRSLAADLDRHQAAGATARPAGSDASRPGQFPP